MTELFLKLLNMSISASWLVLAVIALRLLLKKAPKWSICLLWGIVALRLLVPVVPESAISLIPSAEVIPQDIVTSQRPAIHSGIATVNKAVNSLITEQSRGSLERLLYGAAMIWITGLCIMLLCSTITYWNLRRKVRVSERLRENIFVCDEVASPFILGVFRPRIYIPSGMEEVRLEYVLSHENAHLRRRDHWWKPLGFLLLTVYWFNPLLWLAYSMLCRDIERACDEEVIVHMDNAGKKGYAEALIACSVHRRMIMACPVAFGEVDVKSRIKGIVHYKKPGFWVILISVALCVVTAGCFLTNPEPCEHIYHSQITVNPTCAQAGVETFTCEACADTYKKPVAVLEHTFDAGVVAVTPTCTATGTREFTCTGCGSKRRESIEKTAHTAGELTVTKEPNCTERGEKSTTCTVCQLFYVVEVLETDGAIHHLQETVVREATCTAEGEGVWNCTRCDYSEACTYQTVAHDHRKTGTIMPGTCLSGESTEYACINCGHTYWVEAPERGEHRWIDAHYGMYVCILCGRTKGYETNVTSSGGMNLIEDTLNPPVTMTPDNMYPTIVWDVAAIPISPTNTNPTNFLWP